MTHVALQAFDWIVSTQGLHNDHIFALAVLFCKLHVLALSTRRLLSPSRRAIDRHPGKVYNRHPDEFTLGGSSGCVAARKADRTSKMGDRAESGLTLLVQRDDISSAAASVVSLSGSAEWAHFTGHVKCFCMTARFISCL